MGKMLGSSSLKEKLLTEGMVLDTFEESMQLDEALRGGARGSNTPLSWQSPLPQVPPPVEPAMVRTPRQPAARIFYFYRCGSPKERTQGCARARPYRLELLPCMPRGEDVP